MIAYIKRYPLSLIVIAIIWYLSFFTPPETELNEIPYIDKMVHVCMYGGLSVTLWIEYLFRHYSLMLKRLITGAVVCPILMSGCIEVLQATCTETRSGDWMDFAANCTGVILASVLGYYICRPVIWKYKNKACQ